MSEKPNKSIRTQVGRIISDKRQATRTVEIQWARPHPQYGKVVRGTTLLHMDDSENKTKAGDLVRIAETRPLSKTKRWKLVEVIESARLETL